MKINNLSFIEILKNIIFKDKNLCNSYNNNFPNQKYSIDLIINEIIYVLKTGISWRNIRSKIHWILYFGTLIDLLNIIYFKNCLIF